MSGDPYAQSRIDLAATVTAQVNAADAAWAASNYPLATSSYQQAGQIGASTLGPEIDGAGFPNATQPYTQQAWQLNAKLAAMNAAAATEADALAAQALAGKIVQLYDAAINAGSEAAGGGSSAFWPVAISLVGVGALAGLVVGIVEATRKHASRAATRKMTTRRSRRVTATSYRPSR